MNRKCFEKRVDGHHHMSVEGGEGAKKCNISGKKAKGANKKERKGQTCSAGQKGG